MKLAIKKTQEYLWRKYAFGNDAGHNYVTCWWVVDTENNAVVGGGFSRGDNTRSGTVVFPRKKDVRAFMEGFTTYLENPSIADNNGRLEASNPYSYQRIKGSLTRPKRYDTNMKEFYEGGVFRAWSYRDSINKGTPMILKRFE